MLEEKEPALEGTRTGHHSLESSSAASSIQKKAIRGSWSPDDPDRPRWDAQTQLVSEHDYHDAGGRYICTKIKGKRTDGQKAFLTGVRGTHEDVLLARGDPDAHFFRWPIIGNYRPGHGGKRVPLFRLPELTRDMEKRPDDPVLVLEGEKDVDRARALSLIATTNPDGALSWDDSFSEHLRQRDVVVLLDNDPNGRKRGKLLPVRLWRYAKSIKVVTLPNLPEHGDLSDYLDRGGTREALLKIVAETEPWRPFDRDDDEAPYKSSQNARLALDLLGVEVRRDQFADRFTVSGLPSGGPTLEDKDVTHLRIMVAERCGIRFGKDEWWDYVTDYGHRRPFHPVREYLAQLRWDGVPRLETWLSRYGGAEESAYSRAVGSLSLIAAVRRVRHPGCKFDEVPVLEGVQGGNKSSALRVLAVRDDWFVDSLPIDADAKVVMEQISGAWIVEFAELSGLNKSDVEKVKAMVARQHDKARLSYGRLTTERPRQCVFFGTTNASRYLRDATGNRRFWPVAVDRFDLKALARDRDQLWAEAAAREAEGASIRLPEPLWHVAGERQAERMVRDSFFETLSDALEGKEGKVRTEYIWEAVGLQDKARRTQAQCERLHAAMTQLGWAKPPGDRLRFAGNVRASAWVKGDQSKEVTRDELLSM